MFLLSACGGDAGPVAARPGLQTASVSSCDTTGCPGTQSCAIYCSGSQTRFDCHVPGPSDVPIGANCVGRTCSTGVCVTPPAGTQGSIAECLPFCKLDSECKPGFNCDPVTVYFNCDGVKATPLQATVCRRRL
jgi:hypothetical protein